jgi:hypothetical protein
VAVVKMFKQALSRCSIRIKQYLKLERIVTIPATKHETPLIKLLVDIII